MKKALLLIGLFTSFAMHASEVENKEQKKIVTYQTRIVRPDGTSERVLTTTNSKGYILRTIVKFAKDGKTVIAHGCQASTKLSRKDLLILTAIQNRHHVELSISGFKKFSNRKKVNAATVKHYAELIGLAEVSDNGSYKQQILFRKRKP